MDSYITSTLKLGHKVSFILWLIDQYTSQGCNEEATVYLNGHPASFQRKAGGYLVFTDLEEDHYHLQVEAPYYLSQELEVTISSLDRNEPVVYVALQPAPPYRFKPGATLIRASLGNKKGDPVCTCLTAMVSSDNCARAKLGRQGAKAGATELSLVDMTGRLAPGDRLLIRTPEGKTGEICEISIMRSGEGIYSLKDPLSSDHSRGELLMPLIISHSDERGEAVIALRQLPQKECRVQVVVSADGSSQPVEVTVTTGRTHHLGKIIL